MNYKRKSNPLIVLLTLLLAVTGEQLYAMETGVYQAPDISKFILIDEKDSDGDSDGVKETHVMYYVNVARDSIFSMTTKDRLWAWSLESPAGAGIADLERNYVIRDSNCDGVFDQWYSLDEQFYLPDCLK